MKINDLTEDGVIVKGVNTTPDVQPGETERQAKKFFGGNGKPKPLGVKGATPNQAFNLGLVEAEDKKDILKGMDAKTVKAINNLMIKFPHAKDPITAIIADIEDSQEISIRNDLHNERRDKALDQKVTDLDKRLSALETQKSTGVTEDEDELTTVQRAELFAQQAHKDHKRKYTGDPYYVHLDEVRNIVKGAGGSEDMQAAALLHDTVEDTSVTPADIMKEFGPHIAKLVVELTDISKPEDGNRATRKAMDRNNLAGASAEAQTIKYADLISNGKDIMQNDPKFAKVYMKEKADLLRVMTKGDSRLRSAALDMLPDELKENMSVTGTARRRLEKKKGLEIGSPEWFEHWFDLPYLKEQQLNENPITVGKIILALAARGFKVGKDFVTAWVRNAPPGATPEQVADMVIKTGAVSAGAIAKANKEKEVEEAKAPNPEEMDSPEADVHQGLKRYLNAKPMPVKVDEIRLTTPKMRPGGGAEGKSIEQSIKIHIKLMKQYMDKGMDKDEASKKAMADVMNMKPAERKKFLKLDENNGINKVDIQQLETFADRLFGKVGIDVEFTKHFVERVNDIRNQKPITMSELTRLFKQEYKQWGKPIAQMGPDSQAVMKDLQTDINLPFALEWDDENQELDLIAKTVMRKPDFKTSNKEFPVETKLDEITGAAHATSLLSTIDDTASQLGVNPNLARALAYQESGIKQDIVGDKKLKNKAFGMFQVRKPALDDVNRLYGTNYTIDDVANDARINSEVGLRYFQAQKEFYGAKNDQQALRGYNGGPGAIKGKNKHANKYSQSVIATNKTFQSGQQTKYATSTQPPQRFYKTVDNPQTTTQSPTVQQPAPTKVKVNYNQLAKASGIADPNKIFPGQKINLPNGGTYTIQSGDTLSKIAQNYNRGLIGENVPNTNKPGTFGHKINWANKNKPQQDKKVATRGTQDPQSWWQTVLQKGRQLFDSVESFTDPNFEVEWDEAKRYPEFVKIGKKAWIKLAKTGKPIDVDNELANKIENTEAGEENRHEFDNLEEPKKERFRKAVEAGTVELPIIARYSDGYLELVAGNTRLTGMMNEFGSGKAWIFDVPDEIAVLGESEQLDLKKKFEITDELKQLDSIFKKGKHEIRIVGGAVRDLALGKNPKDIDLATDATPQEMQKMFDGAGVKHIPTGIEHGTITAVINGEPYEITTLRADVETDGRRAEVEFVRSWEEDAKRRDLTYNAMSMDFEGTLYDYHGGMDDLQDKVTKFVGDPEERIKEDYLRTLRYFRFQGRLDTPTFDRATMQAISNNTDGLKQLSVERVWMEMSKILSGGNIAKILTAMDRTGVANAIGLKAQNVNTVKDGGDPIVNLARITDDETIGPRWKMSNEEKGKLGFLLSEKGKTHDKKWYTDMMADGFDRTQLDALARYNNQDDMIQYIKTFKAPEFPVDGNDLIKMGHARGPGIGKTLMALRNQWKQGNFSADKDELLKNITPDDNNDDDEEKSGYFDNNADGKFDPRIKKIEIKPSWATKTNEEGPFGVIARKAGHLINKSQYMKAAEMLHKILKRKYKENDGKIRHSLGYYAQMIGNQTGNKINWRELEQEYLNMYGNAMFEDAGVTVWTNPEYQGADVDTDYYNKQPAKLIDIAKLVPFEPADKMDDKNSAANLAQFVKHIQAGGKINPVVITKHQGKWLILDGHHRYFASLKAGVDKISVVIVDPKDLTYRDDVPIE